MIQKMQIGDCISHGSRQKHRDHLTITIMGKKDDMGKNNFIYCKLKYVWIMRNKYQKKQLTLTLRLSQAQLHSFISHSSTSLTQAGIENGVHNSSSLPLLSSHTFHLVQHGSLPWAAVLHNKPAWACPHHRLKYRYLL